MAIDVTAELTIDAPRGHVAEYAMNSEKRSRVDWCYFPSADADGATIWNRHAS